MLTVLQIFLTMFTCLSVSIIFFVAVSVFFLSFGSLFSSTSAVIIDFFDMPVRASALIGAIIGATHGLITGTIFCWQKPDSILNGIWTTFIGTEVFLALIAIAFVVNFLMTVNLTISHITNLISTVVSYYAILTIVFLLPSVFMGGMNGFILKFLYSANFAR